MIEAGFTTTDPITQTRTVVLEGDKETDGHGWVLEVHCPPRAAPHILGHIHLSWTETFEIVPGTAHYKRNGQQESARAGDTIVMPPGQAHIHPWNAGDTDDPSALLEAQRAHAYLGPGQFTGLMPHAATVEGRIHFAGEHTSAWHGWMQGRWSPVTALREK